MISCAHSFGMSQREKARVEVGVHGRLFLWVYALILFCLIAPGRAPRGKEGF